MAQGGINLLSMTAAHAEDPQTLRMVAGAVANLCGNGKLSSLTFIFLFQLSLILPVTLFITFFINSHVIQGN